MTLRSTTSAVSIVSLILVAVAVQGGADEAHQSPVPRSAALEFESTMREITARVGPSIVAIAAFVRVDEGQASRAAGGWQLGVKHDFPGFALHGSGSGVMLSEDGYMLTNRDYLLKADGSLVDLIDVETADNRHTISRVVGMEPTLNMAILKLEVFSEGNPPRFEPIVFGDSHELLPGHMTVAVADPFGPDRFLQTGLLASTPNRECYQEQLTATYLQVAMSAHPGAYGGALVNLRGEFVGMLTPREQRLGGPAQQPLGIEFALPSNIIKGLYKTIQRNESYTSPWLGYAVMSLPELQKELGVDGFAELDRPRVGIYIENVFEPSSAYDAGIRPGDFLVKFNGHYIGTPLDFQKYLYMAGIDSTVEIELYRAGESFTLELEILARPEEAVTR